MNIKNFREIDVSDINSFKNCLGNRFNNSESSVATMYMWQHYAEVKYCIEDNTVFSIYKDKNGVYSSFMPYGKDRCSAETVDKLIKLYKENNANLKIRLCTDDFVDFLHLAKYDISVHETPNSFDYVYNTKDLIELKGKKFHGKKNHFNSFTKKYSYDYVKYEKSMLGPCLDFCSRILKDHYADNIRGYDIEMASISKTFNNFDLLGLKCGTIMLDDKIIALSVGELLNDKYALIHIEKADYEYREAYSVINRLFLINEFSDTLYVNREEDMGIEGLRRAKQSYHPCHMIKKYTVEFNG